jgi:hypothetical protein
MTIIEAKVQCLKSMDKYIRDEVQDEENFELWIAEGVPDEASENDYKYIAENDEEYKDTCKLFYEILINEGLIKN